MSDNPTHLRLSALTPLQLIIEIVIVIVAALFVTRPFMDMTPQTHLAGGEAEYLMAAASTASTTLRTEGYLPLWQPMLGTGDTVVNNPFSYLLNPLMSWPSLIMGPDNGIKLSMILLVICTGLGGWVLARLLGLHTVARVTLALLCIGKGNLHAILSPGYFQLSASQMFFPWILAGVVGLLWYKHRRWPIVLTAVSIALMFWAGLIWYVYPLAILLGMITLAFAIRVIQADTGKLPQKRVWIIDWSLFRRMIGAGILTLILCAATLIPILLESKYYGGTTISGDAIFDLRVIFGQYIWSTPTSSFGAVWAAYYSFISPFWFFVVVAVGVFLSILLGARPWHNYPRSLWRFILILSVMVIFFTLWAAGINPVIEWLYQAIPLTNQFRHVERVMAMGSFVIAVLLAIFLDMAWVGFVLQLSSLKRLRQVQVRRAVTLIAPLVLVMSPALAAREVLLAWNNGVGIESQISEIDGCLAWLRNQNGDKPLSVWMRDYGRLLAFFQYNVRFSNMVLDFYKPHALPSTWLKNGDLTAVLPAISGSYWDWDYGWEKLLGYTVPLPGTPTYSNGTRNCFFQRTVDSFSYAFTVPTDILATKTRLNPDLLGSPANTPVTSDQLLPSDTQPVTSFIRHNDYIGLIVPADPNHDQVLTLDEVAFPGWNVYVNNTPANLEVVGGQIGILLPKGSGNYQVLFQYRPLSLIIGLLVTLFSIILCTAYLLRLDRFIPSSVYNTIRRLAENLMIRTLRFLVNPNIIGTDEIVDEVIIRPKTPFLRPPQKQLVLPEPKREAEVAKTQADWKKTPTALEPDDNYGDEIPTIEPD